MIVCHVKIMPLPLMSKEKIFSVFPSNFSLVKKYFFQSDTFWKKKKRFSQKIIKLLAFASARNASCLFCYYYL